MNAAKTAETLEGLLDLGAGDSIKIDSFGQRVTYSKEPEEYSLTLRVTRCKDKETCEAAKEKPAEKHPAGSIIP